MHGCKLHTSLTLNGALFEHRSIMSMLEWLDKALLALQAVQEQARPACCAQHKLSEPDDWPHRSHVLLLPLQVPAHPCVPAERPALIAPACRRYTYQCGLAQLPQCAKQSQLPSKHFIVLPPLSASSFVGWHCCCKGECRLSDLSFHLVCARTCRGFRWGSFFLGFAPLWSWLLGPRCEGCWKPALACSGHC